MNNNYDEIDNILFDYFKEHKKVPQSIKKTIDNTLLVENRKFNPMINIKKFIISIIGLLTLTGGIVFAKDISNYIQYFFQHNNGMDTAIQNGYIDTPASEYIESNGTKVKVNKFLMDDYNLNLDLSIKLSNNVNQSKILRMNFPDMIITDENNNILFCQDKNVFTDYCSQYNLNHIWGNTNDSYINSGSNYYIKSNDKDDINFIYNIYAKNFPKSKKIKIKFNKIIIAENEDLEQDNITLTGNWNLEIDVPKEFYESEEIHYKVKSCSNEKINITQACVSATCTKLELKIEEPPDLPYDLSDDEETKSKKIDEFIEKQKKQTYQDYMNQRKFKNEYIENANGQKFYPARSTEQDGGYSNIDMKYLVHWQTFDLTKYDATNTLKLYFDYKDEMITIELEKD